MAADAFSILLADNDDAVGGLQSQILGGPGSLGPGRYYVALGGFNTGFASGFDVVGGLSSGNYELAVNSLTHSGALGTEEIQWFSFDVIPEPSTFGLMVLAGLAIAGMRKRLA